MSCCSDRLIGCLITKSQDYIYIYKFMIDYIDLYYNYIEMEGFARIILNNAQTSYDGGVIGNILRNVQLINNTNVKKEIMPYVMSLRMTGGYIAALFFGILWILTLLFIMTYLCYLHFKRPKSDNNRKWMFSKSKLFMLKKEKMSSYSNSAILQLFAIGAIILPVLLLIGVSFINLAYLSHSISANADNYNPNETSKVTSMLPALKSSLISARYYLSTFAKNAIINTASTVEEIIVATKKMQNDSMTAFNKILMTRLGVIQTFKYGDQMTKIIVLFFQHSTELLETKQEYDKLYGELYPTAMDPSFGVFRFVALLRESFGQLNTCDQACLEASAFFGKKFVTENSFAETDFASSFLFVMKQRNETQQSVAAKSAHGRRQMAKRMEKTKQRMESLVDIAGTIRNMTTGTWTKMDVKLQEVIARVDRIILALGSDKANSLASRYSLLLVTVLLIPLLLAVVVTILSVILVCDGAQNDKLRVAAYASLSLLSLALVAAMVAFLVGGKLETELCRYLRTEQPIISTANGSQLVLDTDINRFLEKTLPTLPKSEFPMPTPNNIMFGLIRKCRENEPILVAIDAIKSFDARALSKPETSNKIVAIGRMLLIESLNETDPKKMMPANMQDSLKQASQMDMFKKIDINANIAKIPRSPIHERRDNITVPVSINIFLDRVEKFIKGYGPLFRDQQKREVLELEFTKLLSLLERFNLLTDKARDLFRGINSIPKIEPVVTKLQSSLISMIGLMSNKTELLDIATRYFDEHIAKSAPANAAGIMARFGPVMMSKLGHCRPLFDAYQSSVDTTCNVVVSKLNVYWLHLGTIVLLLTIFLAVVFLTMLRSAGKTTSTNKLSIDLEEKKSVNKPLVEAQNGVDQIDQTKEML